MINLAAKVVVLVLISLILLNKNVINPMFIESVASVAEAGEAGSKVLKNLHWIILACIYIATICETVSAILRAKISSEKC